MFKTISVTSIKDHDRITTEQAYYEEEFEKLNEYLNNGWVINDKVVATPSQSSNYSHVIFILYKNS